MVTNLGFISYKLQWQLNRVEPTNCIVKIEVGTNWSEQSCISLRKKKLFIYK